MVPRPRKYLINVTLFFTALFLILYLNRPGSSAKTFAWNTIRYESSLKKLPPSRGTCPGLAESTKPALVVSRVAADGDPEWLQPLSSLYHLCVYNADRPGDQKTTHLEVPANRGHEAMAYLTFLIDNYHDIPTAGAVFVHGSRWAWHNDHSRYDNAALLSALNVSAALQPMGYHNLRCDWSASTCERSAVPQGSLETTMNAALEPWNARATSDSALPRALEVLFKSTPLGRTHTIRAQCCAQFVVSKDRILQHSRTEFESLRQWLLDGSAPADDRVSGRIISYLWHILFLPRDESGVQLDELNSLACPSAQDCYCRLYGLCDLHCGEPGRCHGQYTIPPDYKLPPNWGATHP